LRPPTISIRTSNEATTSWPIDSSDPTPDVALALATAEFYGLNAAQAGEILKRARAEVGQ
jgi:hypothetical protein